MASRAFSFDIPKPLTDSDANGGSSLQRRLHAELLNRYPTESGVPEEELYNKIIDKLYPTGINNREIKFDRGFSRQTQQKVIVAAFGDGYEQRVRDGINTKREMFSMNLTNRLWQEITLISLFFDIVQPASFLIRLERESVRVALQTYSVNIGHDDVQSITAQLKRVYAV